MNAESQYGNPPDHIETIRLVFFSPEAVAKIDVRRGILQFRLLMQNFYLIRHGETDWNIKLARLQGHTDIPLNEKGIRQAQALQNLISDLGITKVLSSDLIRAQSTAQLMIGSRLPIETHRDLREVHLGIGEGMTWDEVSLKLGLDFRTRWSANGEVHMDMRFPEGESRSELVGRVKACLLKYLEAHPKERIAFVTHGFVIRSMVYHTTQIEKDFFVPNCAVAPFNYSQGQINYLGPETPNLLLHPHIED
jgi:broad specificity phosphatase PhoE